MLDGPALEQVRAASTLAPRAQLFVLAEEISEHEREQLAALRVRHAEAKPFYVNDFLTIVEQAARPERRRTNSPMRGGGGSASPRDVSARTA